MQTMESMWNLNISKGGKHWAQVTWRWSNDEEEILKRCRTIMTGLGLGYEYSLTLWQGQGKSIDLFVGGWSLVKEVYRK